MPTKIRLTRMGKKKKPFYRVIVADVRAPRDGRYIEVVGTYDPCTDPVDINLNQEKITSWLAKGAQPTRVVSWLIRESKGREGGETPQDKAEDDE